MGGPLELPDKVYFRIGEVCDLLGVRPHVLRYWETEFPTVRPDKSRANQRLYRRRDVEQLAEVRRLLYEEGYTIAGARRRLVYGPGRHPPLADGGPETAAEDPSGELQPPGAERIRGPAPAAPEGPSEASADLAARCRDLERQLEAERAARESLRDRLRSELEAIRRLAADVPE